MSDERLTLLDRVIDLNRMEINDINRTASMERRAMCVSDRMRIANLRVLNASLDRAKHKILCREATIIRT